MEQLHILHLEDSPLDSELIHAHLVDNGLNLTMRRVDTREDFVASVESGNYNLILADHSLPSFDGSEALKIVRETAPDIPFIIVTGTLGEEYTVGMLKQGASDYVLKSRLDRLIPAINISLREAGERAERRRAQAALRESNELFRSLIENASDIITILDAEGVIQYESPAIERVLGYQSHELIGKSYFDILHQDDSEQLAAAIKAEKAVRQTSLPIPFTCRFRHKDSSWRILEGVLTNLLHDPSVRGIVVNSRDVTDRKRAEESIFFQARLLDAVEQAVIALDLDRRILFWNRHAEELYGSSSAEAIGQYADSVLQYDVPRGTKEELQATIYSGKAQTGEIIVQHKRGGKIPVMYSNSPIRNEQGETVGIVSIAMDMTRQRNLEEQLRQAQKMEAVGRLAGGVAHDFNNLLAVIMMQADLLLLKFTEPDRVRHRIEEIKRSSERAAALTQQLLAFSRKQVLQPKLINLNNSIKDVERMLQRLIGEDINLTSIPHVALHPMMADPGQIEQVLMNLAVNARDAMPQGGTLTLETRNIQLEEDLCYQELSIASGDYALLKVTDTGIGMNAETMQRIYEPFFTTKGPGKGTGLGLSTVYGIVKQSGGYITVSSELGQGTSFEIYFPRAARQEPRVALAPELRAEWERGTETILLVEDEELVRQAARDVLEMLGYKVLLAASGMEALEISSKYQSPIHLMLTDVVMPGMSGNDLAGRIAAARPATKILFMSGYTADAIVHHGVLDEGIKLIEKPFTPDALARAVRQMLGSKT